MERKYSKSELAKLNDAILLLYLNELITTNMRDYAKCRMLKLVNTHRHPHPLFTPSQWSEIQEMQSQFGNEEIPLCNVED